MELKTEILCKKFEQMNIVDKKIMVDESSGEYYIVPLNKSYDLEHIREDDSDDDEFVKLTFKNQLLWLKYSNHKKELLLKEYDFKECVVIRSDDVLDIYVTVVTTNCFKRNVWHSNNISLNKKYNGKYMLVLPIFDDMISVREYGIGIVTYQVRMITNEVLLKKVSARSEHGSNIVVTNNVNLNKEALFVVVYDDDVSLFLP
jgi:hypothetical protein